MNCLSVQTLLPTYLENKTTSAQKKEMVHHLGRCDSCLRELLLLSAVYRHVYHAPLRVDTHIRIEMSA